MKNVFVMIQYIQLKNILGNKDTNKQTQAKYLKMIQKSLLMQNKKKNIGQKKYMF